MYMDDILDEVDATIGDLTKKYLDVMKIHVRGLAPLQKTSHGFLSCYVTKHNLAQLMNDAPEQFE